jgi:hypothetical protein
VLGERHHEVPDAARSAVNQNRLPRLQFGMVEQTLPRRQARDRHGGGFAGRKCRGHGSDERGRRNDILGVRPRSLDPRRAEHGRSYSQFRARPDGFDDAREILARRQRQLNREDARHPAAAHPEIDRVDARRLYAHQDLALPGLRTGRVLESQNIRSAIGMHPNRFHRTHTRETSSD